MVPIWPRSAAFDVAVQYPHTVALRADLWAPGGTELLAEGLKVDGGSVTASRTATHLRSGTVELVDRDGTLARLFADTRTVQPYEINLFRGARYDGGGRELLPVGVLYTSGLRNPVFPSAKFSFTCYDRSRRVLRHKFTSVYVVQPGTRYVDAAVALVRSRLPFPVEVVEATADVGVTSGPVAYLESDDPWAKAQELAAAAGCEIFFDQVGRLVVRDIPAGLGGPEFTYAVGANSVVLPESERSVSDDPGFNAVLGVGESSGNDSSIPRHLAVDSNPASQTYFAGPYGLVPEMFNSPTITDPDRAVLITEARLRRWLGANDTVSLAVVPHPGHEPGDVVRVVYGEVDRLMVVDTVVVPLDVSTAGSLALRAQVEVA